MAYTGDFYSTGRLIIMNELMKIDPMQADDWEDVRRIYVEGIKTGNATFQQEAPSWEEWDKSHLPQYTFVFSCFLTHSQSFAFDSADESCQSLVV